MLRHLTPSSTHHHQRTLPDGRPLQPKMALHVDAAISGVLGRSRLDFEFMGAAVQISRALADCLPPGVLVATGPALDALGNASQWLPCGRVRFTPTAPPLGLHINTFRCKDAATMATLIAGTVVDSTLCPTASAVALLSPPFTHSTHQCPTSSTASFLSSRISDGPLDNIDAWALRFNSPLVNQQYGTWLSHHVRMVRLTL